MASQYSLQKKTVDDDEVNFKKIKPTHNTSKRASSAQLIRKHSHFYWNSFDKALILYILGTYLGVYTYNSFHK